MIDWLIIYKNIINKATANEQKKYTIWLNKSYRHVRYSKVMTHYHKNNEQFAPLSDAQLLQNLSKLKMEMSNRSLENDYKKEQSGKRMRILITASSSAAVIILSCFLLNSHFPKESKISGATVKVPTLILDSGSSLALEGDDVIENSYPIEKIDDAKISYLNNNRQIPVAKESSYNTLIVPKSYTYTIILDDSTEVLLNANSELRYPVRFTGEKREVFLKGEGYFKVAKDTKPFIVHTDEISVRVYGTEFNINTYDKENIKAVLLSGSVSVAIKSKSSEEIHMLPNQKFTLNSISEQCHLITINPKNEVSWKNGIFEFDNERLSVVLNEIANWYGIEFHYLNVATKNIRISLKLKRTANLDNVIRAIRGASGSEIIKINMNEYEVE